MNERDFVGMMREAVASTDGTEPETLAAFELELLGRDDPQLVWDLFTPVRGILLKRLFNMAKHQLKRASETQPMAELPLPTHGTGQVSEPTAAADSPLPQQHAHEGSRHSVAAPNPHRRVAAPQDRSRSPRNAGSAQAVIMHIGGGKSQLDMIHNHKGVPIGNLNYYGLANFHDESPMYQRFAARLMEAGIPKSDRPSDMVRNFVTPEEADRMWLDLFKEVA